MYNLEGDGPLARGFRSFEDLIGLTANMQIGHFPKAQVISWAVLARFT